MNRQTHCDQCGAALLGRKPYLARLTKHAFCDVKCWGLWQRKHPNRSARPQKHKWLTLTCTNCQKVFERPRHVRSSVTFPFCSRQCFQDYARVHFRGSGNPSWAGGAPDYYGPNWLTARKTGLKRDRHRCQKCGSRRMLVVHHLREFAEFQNSVDAHELDNLQTLCRSCHRAIHNGVAL
ncbi:MAG: HNH endonuclease [Anaerolineales bacterium]